MTMVRPPMTNFKIIIRADCAVSACSPMQLPPSVYKSSCLLMLGMGGRGSQPLDRIPPSTHPSSFPPILPLHQLWTEQPDLIFGYKGIQIPYFFQVEPELNDGEKKLEQACRKRREETEMETPEGNLEVWSF